ncbi:MAG: hypothetical protein IKD72_01960, partial [Clostridia bacterium]|nr:hypothetical protein [Clostridia bacterium]
PVCQHLFSPFLPLLLNDSGCFFLAEIKDLVVIFPHSKDRSHIWWFLPFFVFDWHRGNRRHRMDNEAVLLWNGYGKQGGGRAR